MREDEGDDDLAFLGFALLWDPPRPEVPAAIRQAQSAGIRVLMITGDTRRPRAPWRRRWASCRPACSPGRTSNTCLRTRSQRGARNNVFARVAPEHKLKLVEALKESGEIVAVTGTA